MKQEHHPKGVRLNNLGANTTDEKIYVGAGDKGYYVDSHNGRLRSLDGNDGDWEKMNGEELVYPSSDPGDWFCIGSIDVNDKRFEVWVEENNLAGPIIRINGQKVAQSTDIPFLKAFPLQMDKNEGCDGEGEVFITDDNSTPLIFNIKDMLDNIANPKYFAGFNYEQHTVNLSKPLDIPVFVELVNVGGSGGLPVGNYQYAIAYVTKSGDRTLFSEKTPVIPVVRALSEGTRSYPWVRTFGDNSNISSKTSYGPKIRFRVTNTLNYDSIEIIRFDYNIGAGIDFTPSARVVGRIDISDGQIDIVDFIDPVDSDREIVLSVEEEESQSYLIETAKGIRYYGKRLVLANVKTVEKVDTSTFLDIEGEKIFPIQENLGTAGHNDPYNHSYRSNEMGGEKTTFGVHFFDKVGGKTFVKEDDDLKNVQYPNRRERHTVNSANYSFGQLPVAADIDGTYGEVFESFSHTNAIRKGDKDTFKNIYKKASRSFGAVQYAGQPSDPNDYQAASGLGIWRVPYLPFKPTKTSDLGDTHDFLPNINVDANGFLSVGNIFPYDPKGFAPEYYSKGYALAGLDNIPDWVRSFSVVRTKQAGRVVLQGLGMYKILPGSYDGPSSAKNVGKDNASMWFFSPDIQSGLISQAEIDNIQQNPGDYKVQFVAPMGFFSEVYSFESNGLKDHLVDMMTYARVQRDQGEINPGVNPTTGTDGYVYYNKYRGVTSPNFDINEGFFSGSDGNKLMGVEFFEEIREGRGRYFHLGFPEQIYGKRNIGGSNMRDFNDVGLMDWTEPFYMINIIKEGAEVPDDDITGFRSTGTHIKLDSIIGLGNGLDGQIFPLVDERWEDCCSTSVDITPDKYLYLRDINTQIERIFYDVTNTSAPAIALIIADITNNGFWIAPNGSQVVGIYTNTRSGSGVYKNHEFSIVFGYSAYKPAATEYVVVKYDNRIPIRFFGGESYVGETIFAPVDRDLKLETNGDDPEETTQFVLNAGFPYGRYEMNHRYYRCVDTSGVNNIQNQDWFSFSHIRNLCVMFNCDNRIAAHYAHQESYPLQYFPLTAYVMRPNVWDDSMTLEEQNIFSEYVDDYGESEKDNFVYGGFRFLPSYNIDYSSRGRIEFFTKPEIGFEEKFDFCNLVIWSLERATNQQDSPGLKTFLVANSFEIEESQGEIKFLYSATYSDKGSNLYAITEKGVCLLVTKKTILSNVDANYLTGVATDEFISQEYWIERLIGSNGEFWRGKAEGTTTTPSEAGDLELEFLIFPNKNSVFTLINNEVRNVGNNQYINRLLPYLSAHPMDTSKHLTAGFDKRRNDYYLDITSPFGQTDQRINFKMFMRNMKWVGSNDYQYDSYVFSDGRFYGMKNLITYLLDEGLVLNGSNIECSLTQVFSKDYNFDKEFVRIGVETGGRSGQKPTSIQFLDENGLVMAEMSQAIFGPDYLLMYDCWEHFIPSKSVTYDPDKNRIQDRFVVYKIIHNLATDFRVVNTTVQYKILK